MKQRGEGHRLWRTDHSLQRDCAGPTHTLSSTSILSSSTTVTPSCPHTSPSISIVSPSCRCYPSSFPSISYSTKSPISQVLHILLLTTLLHTHPILTTAKAIDGSGITDFRDKPSPLYDLDPEGQIKKTLTPEQAAVEEFKLKFLTLLGYNEVPSVSSHFSNGSRPEGKRVRDQLRKYAVAGLGSLHELWSGTMGFTEALKEETLFFHGSDVIPPDSTQDIPSMHVFTVETNFKLPEKTYHDLIIKSAILRMRINRSKALLARFLSSTSTIPSTGALLNLDVFLINQNSDSGSNFTKDALLSSSINPENLLGSTKWRPGKSDIVTVVVNPVLISHLIDLEQATLTLGLRVTLDTSVSYTRGSRTPLKYFKSSTQSTKTFQNSSAIAPSSSSPSSSSSSSPLSTTFSFSSLSSSSSKQSTQTSLIQETMKKIKVGSPKKLTKKTKSTLRTKSSSSLNAEAARVRSGSVMPSLPSHLNSGQSSSEIGLTDLLVSRPTLELTVATVNLRHSPGLAANRPPGRRRKRRSVRSGGRCSKRRVRINFNEIGWDFVVDPEYYDAYFCSGSCPRAYMPASTFSGIQSYLHHLHPHRVPPPTCAPKGWDPFTVLYQDDRGEFEQHTFPEMIVSECRCR